MDFMARVLGATTFRCCLSSLSSSSFYTRPITMQRISPKLTAIAKSIMLICDAMRQERIFETYDWASEPKASDGSRAPHKRAPYVTSRAKRNNSKHGRSDETPHRTKSAVGFCSIGNHSPRGRRALAEKCAAERCRAFSQPRKD